MVKFSTLALGLLAIAGEVCTQSKVKVMPFGASIVSVRPSLSSLNPYAC
jgi:hypothetical protein